MKFEFIDYSGSYPTLCSGRLTFKADGKRYEADVHLTSGGNVWFDDSWEPHVEEGPWEDISDSIFDKYPELKDHKWELLCMVKENVPCGCCGGCI
jgi:hypothetical protein